MNYGMSREMEKSNVGHHKELTVKENNAECTGWLLPMAPLD